VPRQGEQRRPLKSVAGQGPGCLAAVGTGPALPDMALPGAGRPAGDRWRRVGSGTAGGARASAAAWARLLSTELVARAALVTQARLLG
jgi:hypothetical protein